LSVECDANPSFARTRLEQILGRPTIVTRSGGVWLNPESGKQARSRRADGVEEHSTDSAEEN
jgi:hypothetical protein